MCFCFSCSLITRIGPISKPEMKEHSTRTSPDKSVSSPLSSPQSSKSDSLPSIKNNLSDTTDSKIDDECNNNTTLKKVNNLYDERINASVANDRSNINDELNNSTTQNEFIDRHDEKNNAPDDDKINNITNHPKLEPIEMLYSMESVDVSLNDEFSVKASFHTVGEIQFSLMIYFKKLKIFYRIGDFHPGRGFFACCGYSKTDLGNLNLFFIDEDFEKPCNLTYKYYMKSKFMPNLKINQKVTIMI